MAQALTPYDTGERCEAKPWLPYGTDVTETTPAENFGKVDFDDDAGQTICVVYVERSADGRHRIHITPLVDDADLNVVVDKNDES